MSNINEATTLPSESLQQGDVAIIQRIGPIREKDLTQPESLGGVEFGVRIVNGTMEMTQTFETAIIMSLFGGNEQDDGTAGSDEAYWGNLLENEAQFKLVSRTQFLLRSLPATSSNLRLLEQAVRADLQWFLDTGIASSIDNILATIPGVGRITISGNVNALGLESSFSFTEIWKASV